MPTAVAMPWPSGPVVVSIAGMLAVFGMAGGGRMELAEALASPRSPCRHGRSGRAARRAASSRGRPTARSGRGPASAGRRHRTCGSGVHSAVATSAMPIGMPGWPDFAASTASIASARMALAICQAWRGWPGQDLRLVGEHRVIDDGRVGSGHVVSFGLPAAYRSMHLRRQPWPRTSRLRHKTCYSNRVTTFASTSFMTMPGTRSRERLTFRARRSIARG